MNKNEQLHEQYEDALFALLMNEVAEANGNELMQKNEELLADPDAAVPERLSKRCMQVIEKSYRKAQIQNTVKSAVRVLNRVALWILIPVFLFVGVFAASETVRVKTMNLLIREFNIGTEFRLIDEDKNSDEFSSENTMDTVLENAVPSDFSLVFSNSNTSFMRYLFRNNNGAEIRIVLHSLDDANESVIIDTENAKVWYESIGLNDVMLVQKDNTCQAVWSDNATQMMYTISGLDTSMETILNISKKIIEVNK
mgnify:CR=1 FL=1